MLRLSLFALEANRCQGTLPELGFRSKSTMKELRLLANGFFGSVSVHLLPGLTSIEQVYMQQNHLSGSLPDRICRLGGLKILWIGRNKFYGTLPAVGLRGLCELTTFHIYEN
eukprot:2942956-Amphidinium_carterae.1